MFSVYMRSFRIAFQCDVFFLVSSRVISLFGGRFNFRFVCLRVCRFSCLFTGFLLQVCRFSSVDLQVVLQVRRCSLQVWEFAGFQVSLLCPFTVSENN